MQSATQQRLTTRLYRWMIQPSDQIAFDAERRRARLLSSLLLFAMSMVVLSVANGITASIFTLVFLFVAYGLSRTRYYQWGALLAVAALMIPSFDIVLTSPAANLSDTLNVALPLSWLILALILASLWSNGWVTALVTAITIGLVLGLRLIRPEIDNGGVIWISVLLGVSGGLLVLAAALRNRDLKEIETQAKTVEDQQQQLLKSAERYRGLVENVSDIVYTIDVTGHFTYVSVSAARLLGYKTDSVVGMRYTDLVEPSWRPTLRSFYEQQVKNPESETTLAFPIITQTHQTRWVEQKVTPLFDQNHVLTGFQGVVRDITERRYAEEKLRALYTVMAQSALTIDEQLTQALKIGTELLKLDLGIISQIEGDKYTVLYSYSTGNSLKTGQVFDSKKTYCDLTYQSDDVVSINHMGASDYKHHPCYAAFGLEAYIGVPLHVDRKRFGTLSFYSVTAREQAFADTDRDFFSLMGKWVSTMLERKFAEEQMRASEANLRLILDNTPVVITKSDRDCRIEFTRVPGVDVALLEPLVGQSYLNFMPEEFHPVARNAVRQVFDEQITVQYESNTIDPRDGTQHWYLTNVAPIIENGRVVSALLVNNDITERKQAEVKIQALLEAIPDMLFQINTEGIFLDFKAAKNLKTAVPPEAFLGKDIRQVLPPLGEPAVSAVRKAVETGSEQLFEYELPEADGLHNFEARITPSGTDSALVIVRDVTTLKRTAAALEQQRIFLRQVIDFSPSMIFVKDYDARFVLANPIVANLYNVSPEELIGKSDADFNSSAEEVQKFLEDDRRVIDSGEPLFVEEPVTDASGQTHWFQTIKVPIVASDGEAKYVLGVATDITERKEAEQQIQMQNESLVRANRELAVARKQAEAASKLKSQFLATMSHELRTPLNAVVGYAQLQLAGMAGEMTDEQLGFQERILVNAQHLLQLINEVLDLSKIEAGRMELIEKPFNLRECLEEIMFQNRVLAEDKNLSFDLLFDEQLPESIVGDRGRIKQIIINLVSNAIKFTDNGSVKVEVGLPSKQNWRVTVTDTGVGISPTMQETIFDEFRQAENGIERGGTGLGLAIVRKLVLMMGGNIRLTSEVGRGSAFTITLPLITEMQEASELMEA